jgi:hypothetical protein
LEYLEFQYIIQYHNNIEDKTSNLLYFLYQLGVLNVKRCKNTYRDKTINKVLFKKLIMSIRVITIMEITEITEIMEIMEITVIMEIKIV